MTEREFVQRARQVELLILTDLARRIGQRLRGVPVTAGDDALRAYLALLADLPAVLTDTQAKEFQRASRLARRLPGSRGPAVRAPLVPIPDPMPQLREAGLAVYRSQNDIFRRAVEASMADGNTTTRLAKSQQAFAQLTRAGVPAFVDRAGRTWALGTYTEMATRTATGRAAVAGRLEGYASEGRDLVIVSDAPEECERCRPYEGRVFSLSGMSQEYPALAGALAGGLHHPNCRHDERPYLPGLTKRFGPTADPEGDAIRQTQRRLERRVRAAKIEAETADAMARGAGIPAPPGPREQLADARRALRDFIDEADRKGHVSRRRVGLGAR